MRNKVRKPRNRKERIDFIALKCGLDFATGMYRLTDRQVKEFCDLHYDDLKAQPDYLQPKNRPIISIREKVFVDHGYYHSCIVNKDLIKKLI